MSTLNNWGSDSHEDSVGDVIYEAVEDSVREGVEEIGKQGVEMTGVGLDKITDRIEPVKKVKDKAKNLAANNPMTRAVNSLKNFRDKVINKAKKLSKDGLHAVGRAALNGIKSVGHLIAANPVAAFVIIVVIILVVCLIDDSGGTDYINNLQSDNVLLQNPMYNNLDGMSDDDIVVVLMGDCVDQQYDTMGELDADKEEMAKYIYSVFRSYGFSNVSIAGMLGNIDIESGLDPSAIEGIFSEYGFLGTKKAEALLSMTNYTENILFPKYVASGVSLNRNGYKVINDDGDTVYYCGMGLVQWTGGNAYTLVKAAKTLNMDWYNREFQLAYMLSDCMYRSGFFAGWVTNQETGNDDDEESWVEAAKRSGLKFAHEYEGNTSDDEDRQNAAAAWYNIIQGWGDSEVDQSYSDSIVALATELGGLIQFLDVENAQYRCLAGNVFDNTSLAAAAVSFAWPTKAQSYNNGTNLYQVVHDSIFPTDYIYKACDRTVASAVRWSGTDDEYPRGNTASQLRYLETSSKWEKVGAASSLTIDDLLPGDIFCLNGHTFMYVGESAIQSAYTGEAEAGSNSVSGSLNERSPACDKSTTSILNRNGQDWNGRGVYNVYRCTNPDKSSTYSSIGSGVTN